MNPIMKLYQHTKEEVFHEMNQYIRQGGIVFLGDSITDFFRINEFFPDHYVINRGISGDTTDGVLARMNESVYALNPSKVFLMIGTNDLGVGKSPDHVIGNIDNIIRLIREKCPQAKIYLESVYPVSRARHKKIKRFIVRKRRNVLISQINAGLMKLSSQYGITYIDVYSHLIDGTKNLRLEYTVEGLHLTISAYHVVAEILRPYVTGDTSY